MKKYIILILFISFKLDAQRVGACYCKHADQEICQADLFLTDNLNEDNAKAHEDCPMTCNGSENWIGWADEEDFINFPFCQIREAGIGG